MQLVKPLPFDEAVNKLGAKSLIGSAMRSDEWRDVPVALRERAFFSSQVENVRFLQRARDGINDFLQASKETLPNGETVLKTGSRADFVEQMQAFLKAEGVDRTDGSLTDIAGEKRLGLIFDTQTRQANDYGYWREGQDADVLDAFPAQRFIRVLDVEEPRTSHTDFEDQVYLKWDPIWANTINEDFGVPWGPWAWGCGHDVEDVSREEAEELGLLQPGEGVKVDSKNFNENLEASTKGLDPDLLAKLKEEFGDQVTIEGETMRWTAQEPATKTATTPPPSPTPAPAPVVEQPADDIEKIRKTLTERMTAAKMPAEQIQTALELPPQLLKYADTVHFAKTKGGAFYSPTYKIVTMNADPNHWSGRPVTLRHEFGHHVHHASGIASDPQLKAKFTEAVQSDYATWKEAAKERYGSEWRDMYKPAKAYRIVEEISQELGHGKFSASTIDEKHRTGRVADTIMGLSDGKYGTGHPVSYMKEKGEYEVFAHSISAIVEQDADWMSRFPAVTNFVKTQFGL